MIFLTFSPGTHTCKQKMNMIESFGTVMDDHIRFVKCDTDDVSLVSGPIHIGRTAVCAGAGSIRIRVSQKRKE